MSNEDRDNKPTIPCFVWVIANDAHGAKHLLDYTIDCTAEDRRDGDHFAAARRMANLAGFSDPVAFDEQDPAGAQLMALRNFQSHLEQESVPGDPEASEWEVPVTVDMTLSANIRVRAETRGDAIRLARQYTSEHRELLSLDDANYRRPSDFYCGDPDAVERTSDEGEQDAVERTSDQGEQDAGPGRDESAVADSSATRVSARSAQ